jgi:hypothetical protein
MNGKEYTMGEVKARMFRKAIAMTDAIDLEHIKAKDLDDMVGFLVEAYGNQFTLDDVYDGLNSADLMPALTGCITNVVSGVADKLESKNG